MEPYSFPQKPLSPLIGYLGFYFIAVSLKKRLISNLSTQPGKHIELTYTTTEPTKRRLRNFGPTDPSQSQFLSIALVHWHRKRTAGAKADRAIGVRHRTPPGVGMAIAQWSLVLTGFIGVSGILGLVPLVAIKLCC